MTCAFWPCEDVSECSMVGGCVKIRFATTTGTCAVAQEPIRDHARALAGTEPRALRDPVFIKRRRKALT